MIRSLCLSFVLLAIPVRAEETGPAKGVPELQPLGAYVGTWATQSTLKVGDQPAVAEKGKTTAEWIHDGRFVRQTWALEQAGGLPALNGSTIMTYDAQKKTYRAWLFYSTGSVAEAEGTWDAKGRVFTWTAQNPDGNTTVTKANFSMEGTEKWTITTTNRAGKLVFVMQGTNQREKK